MLLSDRDVGRHALYGPVQPSTQSVQSGGLTRRALLAGAGGLIATSALPTGVWASGATASRRFTVRALGRNIGTQTNTVTRQGNQLTSQVNINIDVKIFGVRLYRYRMNNTEVWEDGQLVSIDAETRENDDRPDRVRARPLNSKLQLESPRYTGVLDPTDLATTTYWTKAFLERETWLSTQDGERYDVSFNAPEPTSFSVGGQPVEALRYQVQGDLPISLYYDLNDEWIGTNFEVRGRSVRIYAEDTSQPLAPLWFNA